MGAKMNMNIVFLLLAIIFKEFTYKEGNTSSSLYLFMFPDGVSNQYDWGEIWTTVISNSLCNFAEELFLKTLKRMAIVLYQMLYHLNSVMNTYLISKNGMQVLKKPERDWINENLASSHTELAILKVHGSVVYTANLCLKWSGTQKNCWPV